MPKLHIIAGPSGAGKSTYSKGLESEGIEFLNVDRGFRELGWKFRYALTVKEARNRIDYEDDFAIDDVFTRQAVEDMIMPAHEAGYDIHARIIGIARPGICIRRINSRRDAGGHWHAPDIVIKRYRESMQSAGKIIQLSNEAHLYDNSQGSMDVLAHKKDGVIYRTGKIIPEWAIRILSDATPTPPPRGKCR